MICQDVKCGSKIRNELRMGNNETYELLNKNTTYIASAVSVVHVYYKNILKKGQANSGL